MVTKTRVHGMTYAEYSLLPDDGKRYQVIEGDLIVSPSPNYQHQRTVLQLGQMMFSYAEAHNLGAVVVAPMDVILEPNTIVQPDILFIRRAHMEIIADVIEGAPDLCVEVLSPSTSLHDRHTKKDVYARCGIEEYWIVDPVRETVAVYLLEDNGYALQREATGDAVVTSAVLTGFQTPARAIFS